MLRPDLPDRVQITTKAKLMNGAAQPGIIARARPPSRDIEGDMTRVRKIRVPDTHAFSQSEANPKRRRSRKTDCRRPSNGRFTK
jgi:hypothetical protein